MRCLLLLLLLTREFETGTICDVRVGEKKKGGGHIRSSVIIPLTTRTIRLVIVETLRSVSHMKIKREKEITR